MSKTYFIDSENVGDNWISLLASTSPEDEILVFYTAKSPHMSYRNLILLKESPRSVSFIECCGGNNALDFQLCTELGYRVHDIADDEFIIVSNDTGFDAVVKYWNQRNFPVRRIQGKMCSHDLPQPEIKAPSSEIPELPAIQNTKSIQNENSDLEGKNDQDTNSNPNQDIADSKAREILYIVGRDNLQVLHESLQQIYGARRGKAFYNAFKADTAYNNYISKHPKLSLPDKQKLYCSIVFEQTDSKLMMPDDFPEFVINSWKKKKNLNSLRASLMNKYGKETGEAFYSLIKTHVKILDKIK